jgi:ElaB/YqjD/DUF883 family membrane-anchored ribosome-binding protein
MDKSTSSTLRDAKDTVSDYVSKTGDDALKTAKQATSDVADYVSRTGEDALKTAKQATSDVANQIGSTASSVANATSEQAKTFAAELERIGRNNPLTTIAGAVLVGVVIGLVGRGRS